MIWPTGNRRPRGAGNGRPEPVLYRLGIASILFGFIGLWAYPTWFDTYNNVELGTYRIHDARDGFRSVSGIGLSPDAAPLLMRITGRSTGGPAPGAGPTTFTFVLDGPDGTVTAQVLTIDGTGGATAGGLEDGRRIALTVGPITGLGDGEHLFAFGQGDRDGIPLSFLDMTLTGAVAAPDGRVRPVSVGLVGLGLLAALLSMLRRRHGRAPRPQRPARRWGRAAGD